MTGETLAASSEIQIKGEQELLQIVRECAASGRAILSNKQSQSALPDAAAVHLNLAQMDKVVEHVPQDQVISIQTGITLGALQKLLITCGQFFPAPSDPDATLFDLIGSGDAGLLESAYGPVRDLILGLSLVTGNGETIKTGGKVVKNVTGYDTTKLFVGSRHSFGLPWLAHLRLYARPQTSWMQVVGVSGCAGALALVRKMMGTGISFTAMELVDARLLERWPATSAAAAGSDAALIVQLSGHERLLRELIPQAQSFTADGGKIISIASDDADLLTRQIYALSPWQLDSHRVFLSISATEFERVSQFLCTPSSPLFTYRCASGRLVLFTKSEDESVAVGSKVAQLLHHKQWAYCTPSGFYRCIADAQTAAISQSLKKQFDPHGCFNPSIQM